MDNTIIRYIDLPRRINAVTVVDEYGDYNIYVNARMSYDACKLAVEHEKEHIRRVHFYTDKPVTECEAEAKDSGHGKR